MLQRKNIIIILILMAAFGVPSADGQSMSRCNSTACGRTDESTFSSTASDSSKCWWPTFIGGDLFVCGEIYGLHLSGTGSIRTGAGPGAEIRVHPVFVGAIVGFCGDEGIHDLSGDYSFIMFYTRAIVQGYRLDIGEIHADNVAFRDKYTPDLTYTSAFLGVGKRWGNALFFEPEVKMIFPIVGQHRVLSRNYEYVSVTSRYHLRDLFFALSVRVGIGFN